MARRERTLFIFGLSLFIAACSASQEPRTATTQPAPTAPLITSPHTLTPTPAPTRFPTATPTPEPEDTGWRALAPGFEWRRLWAGTKAGRERLHLVRFDPKQVRLRVAYQPTHPRTVSQWAEKLTDALVVANAGYFTPEHQATGLIVSDGIARGRSYGPFAGMLAVNANGTIALRWLQTSPYRPGEMLAQAVQSFPVLVKPGGQMGFPADGDEGQPSRRTVVAQDTAGRFILLAAPNFKFSLHELAIWLARPDLEVDIALNLDGGTSTGLWIKDHSPGVDSLVPVPAVIAIEPAGD